MEPRLLLAWSLCGIAELLVFISYLVISFVSSLANKWAGESNYLLHIGYPQIATTQWTIKTWHFIFDYNFG